MRSPARSDRKRLVPSLHARSDRRLMRAIVCDPTAPARIAVREVRDPIPTPAEALVSVRAVSLNRGELRRLGWEVDGWRPGYDVAGVVERAAADGTGPEAGTRVAGVLPNGAWAQQVAIPTRRLAPIPDSVTDEAAACLPVAGLTSLAALHHGGTLVGRTVLITAAAGGVGRMAVQLAVLAGARVIASVGRPERAAALDGMPVAAIETDPDPTAEPVDLAIESIGGATFAAAMARLKPGGTLVTIGASSDEPSTVDVLSFVRRPGVTIRGISLFDELERQGRGSADLASLLALVAAGRLDPGIDRVAGWEDMADLLAALRDRQVNGKAVALVR